MPDKQKNESEVTLELLNRRLAAVEALLGVKATTASLSPETARSIEAASEIESRWDTIPIHNTARILQFNVAEVRSVQINYLAVAQLDCFMPMYYLASYPDVEQAYGQNNVIGAMQHYVTNGIREGRSPNIFFDPVFYYHYYPGIKEAYRVAVEQQNDWSGLLWHWRTHGIPEGKRGNEYFDIAYYLNYHGDLVIYFSDRPTEQSRYEGAFWHWKLHGNWEGRVTAQDRRLRVCSYIGDFRRWSLERMRTVTSASAGKILEAIGAIIGFLEMMEKVNERVDNWVRETQKTIKLQQELKEAKERVEAERYLQEIERERREIDTIERGREAMNTA